MAQEPDRHQPRASLDQLLALHSRQPRQLRQYDSGRKPPAQIDLLGERPCGWRPATLKQLGLSWWAGARQAPAAAITYSMGVKALWGPRSPRGNRPIGSRRPPWLPIQDAPSVLPIQAPRPGSEARDPCAGIGKPPRLRPGRHGPWRWRRAHQRHAPAAGGFRSIKCHNRLMRGKRRTPAASGLIAAAPPYLKCGLCARQRHDGEGRELRHFLAGPDLTATGWSRQPPLVQPGRSPASMNRVGGANPCVTC